MHPSGKIAEYGRKTLKKMTRVSKDDHFSMQEIVSLVEHGCKVIQLDEPVLMRHPEVKTHYSKK